MSGGANMPLAGTPEQQAADPLHLFPNADNARQPTTGGVPATLAALGGLNIAPRQPGGAFMPISRGGGTYNSMASRGAGSLFNPSASPGPNGAQPVTNAPSTKGPR